jgi:hypothetical protein
MWKAGNSAQDCMEVTGHATESMFKRYTDLFSDEEKQARQRGSAAASADVESIATGERTGGFQPSRNGFSKEHGHFAQKHGQ